MPRKRGKQNPSIEPGKITAATAIVWQQIQLRRVPRVVNALACWGITRDTKRQGLRRVGREAYCIRLLIERRKRRRGSNPLPAAKQCSYCSRESGKACNGCAPNVRTYQTSGDCAGARLDHLVTEVRHLGRVPNKVLKMDDFDLDALDIESAEAKAAQVADRKPEVEDDESDCEGCKI